MLAKSILKDVLVSMHQYIYVNLEVFEVRLDDGIIIGRGSILSKVCLDLIAEVICLGINNS